MLTCSFRVALTPPVGALIRREHLSRSRTRSIVLARLSTISHIPRFRGARPSSGTSNLLESADATDAATAASCCSIVKRVGPPSACSSCHPLRVSHLRECRRPPPCSLRSDARSAAWLHVPRAGRHDRKFGCGAHLLTALGHMRRKDASSRGLPPVARFTYPLQISASAAGDVVTGMSNSSSNDESTDWPRS